MNDLLIDYRLESETVTNPDGSFPAVFTEASVVSGPGEVYMGTFDTALALGSTGKALVDLSGLKPDLGRFCLRIVFRADGPVNGRQSLVCSDLLPFELQLGGEDHAGDFNLIGSVSAAGGGRRGPDTRFKKRLEAGTWYSVDLAYDTDTAILLFDGDCLGVYAFPDGTIEHPGGSQLFLGTGLEGESEHFEGALAAFQWYSGIPTEIEAILNEQRTNPEWFVTYKREALRGAVDIGEPTSKLSLDSEGSYVQRHEQGALIYNDGAGAAFELHGPIHDLYFSSRELPIDLGYPVSDEHDAAQAGGRKNLFSRGGIYWSPETGAHPVTAETYASYEMRGESKAIGLPLDRAQPVANGLVQEFQSAHLYSKAGEKRAFAVRGPILDRYLATGGVEAWGFPRSNELPIKKNTEVVGRLSEFESCTIYCSNSGRAHEVHGDIRVRYRDLGGAQGSLGLPTSDEQDIPGLSGPARFNTFENGSILWFGTPKSIVVADPFRVFVGRIHSREEEGIAQGQNDIYLRATLKDGSSTLHSQRWPRKGAADGHNIVEPNITLAPVINPNHPAKDLTLVVDIWDDDRFGGGHDDHLGTWIQPLNIANGWGFRDRNGILEAGPFSKIKSIRGSVKRTIDATTLSETRKWWGVKSQNTEVISRTQYAKAFRDVDSEPNPWNPSEWLKETFYLLIVESLAKHGNCFGMCLEAIYARKDASVFGQPLDEFRDWEVVRDEINIKHQYQWGASTVWWFLEEVLAGTTANPSRVFEYSHAASKSGDNPVLCLTRNWDFSGSPHVLLPVAWNDVSNPREISVIDPFFPGEIRKLRVFPDSNHYTYSGTHEYEGGEWAGGRLYFIPFSVCSERPRVPVWDLILLILGGPAIILGAAGLTEQIADLLGRDLAAHGEEATVQIREGGVAGEHFISLPGLSGPDQGVVQASSVEAATGEFMLRPGGSADFVHTISGVREGELHYVVKQGLSELEFRSTLLPGERVQVQARALGTSAGEIRLSLERDKHVAFRLENKLGVTGDWVSIRFDGIPASADEELQLNPRPGLAGVAVVGQVTGRETVVSVEGLVEGKEFNDQFTVPLAEGVSLKPSTVVANDMLAVASLSELFGAAIDGRLLQPK